MVRVAVGTVDARGVWLKDIFQYGWILLHLDGGRTKQSLVGEIPYANETKTRWLLGGGGGCAEKEVKQLDLHTTRRKRENKSMPDWKKSHRTSVVGVCCADDELKLFDGLEPGELPSSAMGPDLTAEEEAKLAKMKRQRKQLGMGEQLHAASFSSSSSLTLSFPGLMASCGVTGEGFPICRSDVMRRPA